jgi:hypothetical protein
MRSARERAALLRRVDLIERIFEQYGIGEMSDQTLRGVIAIAAGRADNATYEAVMPAQLEELRAARAWQAIRVRERQFFGRPNDPWQDVRLITSTIASYLPGEEVPPELMAELHAQAHASHPRVRADARRELAVLRTDDAIELRTQFESTFVEWFEGPVEEYEASDWSEFRRCMRADYHGYAYEPIMDERERRAARQHYPAPWRPQPPPDIPAEPIDTPTRPLTMAEEPRAGWLTQPAS